MLAFVPKLSKRNIVKKSVRREQENNSFARDFLPVVLDSFFSFSFFLFLFFVLLLLGWGGFFSFLKCYISAGFKALSLSLLCMLDICGTVKCDNKKKIL